MSRAARLFSAGLLRNQAISRLLKQAWHASAHSGQKRRDRAGFTLMGHGWTIRNVEGGGLMPARASAV
jgi:hypothetical protein